MPKLPHLRATFHKRRFSLHGSCIQYDRAIQVEQYTSQMAIKASVSVDAENWDPFASTPHCSRPAPTRLLHHLMRYIWKIERDSVAKACSRATNSGRSPGALGCVKSKLCQRQCMPHSTPFERLETPAKTDILRCLNRGSRSCRLSGQ